MSTPVHVSVASDYLTFIGHVDGFDLYKKSFQPVFIRVGPSFYSGRLGFDGALQVHPSGYSTGPEGLEFTDAQRDVCLAYYNLIS